MDNIIFINKDGIKKSWEEMIESLLKNDIKFALLKVILSNCEELKEKLQIRISVWDQNEEIIEEFLDSIGEARFLDGNEEIIIE
jgi:hypothetical protein